MKKFVYIKDYGWRLVLSSLLELSEYDDTIAIPKLRSSLERVIGKKTKTKDDEYLEIYCKSSGQGFMFGAADVNNKCFMTKMNAIDKYGKIFVNEAGGWFMLQEHMKILKTVETETFKFPDVLYTESDINISKYNGGRHFYATVGGFQVIDKDGDTKWNTEKYAMEVAKKFMKTLNN